MMATSQPKTYTEFLEYQLREAERVLVAIRNEANIVHDHDGFADGYTHIDALVRVHGLAERMIR